MVIGFGSGTTGVVMDAVVKATGVASEDFYGRTKCRSAVRARMVAVGVMREVLRMSIPEIGRAMGRPTSTVGDLVAAWERLEPSERSEYLEAVVPLLQAGGRGKVVVAC